MSLEPLLRYFTAEKQGGTLCLALGVVALGLSVWLWRGAGPFRAMAIPLTLVALLQVGVGAGLLARTDRQVARLSAALAADTAATKTAELSAELARMDRVNASFKVIEVVEVVLIMGGIALAIGFRGRPAVMGIGMGLLDQAAVMLVFDLFAERRAHEYVAWLREIR